MIFNLFFKGGFPVLLLSSMGLYIKMLQDYIDYIEDRNKNVYILSTNYYVMFNILLFLFFFAPLLLMFFQQRKKDFRCLLFSFLALIVPFLAYIINIYFFFDVEHSHGINMALQKYSCLWAGLFFYDDDRLFYLSNIPLFLLPLLGGWSYRELLKREFA